MMPSFLSNLSLSTILKAVAILILAALSITIGVLNSKNNNLSEKLKEVLTINNLLTLGIGAKDNNLIQLRNLIVANDESYKLQIKAREQIEDLFCSGITSKNIDTSNSSKLESMTSKTKGEGNDTDNESSVVINFINEFWDSLLSKGDNSSTQ